MPTYTIPPWANDTTPALNSTRLADMGQGIVDAQTGVEQSPAKKVKAATTANITLSGAQTIDGVSVVAGDRLLVKDQTTASQNGIYVVASSAWSRATDADSNTELYGGVAVSVQQGTTNGGKVFSLITGSGITLGTTSLVFDELPSKVQSDARYRRAAGGVFHVEDYGARGNDSSFNNRPAILAALAALVARGGGEILFGPKTYYYTAASESDAYIFDISNTTGITIRGEPSATLKYTTANTNDAYVFHFVNSHDIHVTGMTFDSNWTTLPVSTSGRNVEINAQQNSSRLKVTDCVFKNNADVCITDETLGDANPGLTDRKVTRSIITRNRFENCNDLYNTKHGGARAGIIAFNEVHDCEGGFKIDGEYLSPTPPFPSHTGAYIISHNIFQNMGSTPSSARASVACQEWTYDVLISHNIFDVTNGVSPVQIVSGQSSQNTGNYRINNNIFRDLTGTYAIDIQTQGSNAVVIENLEIAHNHFETSEQAFVVMRCENTHKILNVSITDNDFIDPGSLVTANNVYRGAIVFRAPGTTGEWRDTTIKNNRFRLINAPGGAGNRACIQIDDVAQITAPFVWEGNRVRGWGASSILSFSGALPIVSRTNIYDVAYPSQTLTASSVIVTDAEWKRVSAASATTMTSAPTIKDGVAGQKITLYNSGSFDITLQDNATLAGSKLKLKSTSVVLGAGESMPFAWDTNQTLWIQDTSVGVPLKLRGTADALLTLQQTDAGSVAGTKEAGINTIEFYDGQLDRQGWIGMDVNGSFTINPEISSSQINLNTTVRQIARRIVSPSSTQSITAAATSISINSEHKLISSDAAYTISTALPDGANGETVKITNVGTFNIILQHGTSFNLRLDGATNKTLAPLATLTLTFLTVYGDWVQSAPLVSPA